MDVLRSMKDLWVLISGTSLLQAKELVGTELESNSDRILNGVLFYTKKTVEPSSKSKLEIEKLITEKYQLQFIEKISGILKINEIQCYDLFCSYLLYEYKGTRENLQHTLKNERLVQILLQEVWNYYYSERFYSLLCLKQILCHWQNDNHPYQDLYEGFLEIINKNGAVSSKAISQLEDVNNAEIPHRESYGQSFNDSLIYRWVIYNLKEQLEILQILILLFKDMEPTTDNLKRLFTIFQKHSFGQKLIYRQYINDAIKPLAETIGFMESILFVESLELEWLQNCSENESDEHYLLKDENSLQDLDRVICCLGNHPQHGPIILSWMLLRHWSKTNVTDRSVIVLLGNQALKLNVFEFISQSLSLPLVQGEGVVQNLMNTIVYSLMSLLLSTFELGTLGNIAKVNSVAEKVLCYPNTAKDFWKKGLNDGLGLLLNVSLSNFPVDISSTLRILTSLTRASPESCRKVIDLMQAVPSYCEAVNEFSDSITVHDRWQLIRDKQPYLNDAVVIRRGTIGELVPNCDKSGRPLVKWHQVVDGWKICLLETQVLLNRVTVSDCVTSEFVGQISDLAELVCEAIKMYPRAMAQFDDLFHVFVTTLTKLSLVPQPPTKLLASILNVISAASKNSHLDLWNHMLNNNFLPLLTGNSESIEQLTSGIYCDIGVIGQQVGLQEQASGTYDLLLSFLNLLDTEVLLKENGFLPCLVFIFRDIFPNHHKWRYNQQGVKEKIGVKCLNIFHKLLQLSDWESHKKLNKSQEVCVYSLLHTEASKSLLRIVSTGEHVIRSAMEQQGSHSQGLGQQLTTLVRLSLSVLNRLLLLRNSLPIKSDQPSILEQFLLALPSQPNQLHLILGVAYYAFQRYDPRMAALAVQLLRRCAQDYPMSLLACLGTEASAVRDLFLLRLKSPSEDVRLKVAIIRFLTACVRKQPGLLEMFVNIKDSDVDSNDENKDDEENCLQCAIQILKHKKKGAGYCPRDLHCAVVEFLHSLWAAHHLLAIKELKKESDLWALLCDPLLKEDDLEAVDCRIIAFVIHTLALQGFHGNMFGEVQLDTGVKDVFKEIEEKRLLTKWSKHINATLPSSIDFDLSQQQLECSLLSDQTKDTFLLLLSWRDFLTILAKENLISVSNDDKEVLMNDILTTLQSELDSNTNQKLLNLLAEFYLLLFENWKSSIVSWDKWFNNYGFILDKCASNANQVHPKMIIAVLSIALNGLENLKKIDSISDNVLENLGSSICLLIKNLSQISYASIRENDAQGFQLTSLSILFLKELIDVTDNENAFKASLAKYFIIPTLINLLVLLLQHGKGVQLAHAISIFFVTQSSNARMAEILRLAGLLPQITLPLLNTYEGKETQSLTQSYESVSWHDVFGLSLQITANLLKSLHHFGLNDTFNFIGVHLYEIAQIIQRATLSPHTKAVHYANQASGLVLALAKHQREWQLQHSLSHQLLLTSICNSTVSIIAYLIRPTLLEHLVKQQKSLGLNKSQFIGELSDLGSTPRQFSSGSELWEKASPELLKVQNQLLEFLALSVSTLQCFSPNLLHILSDQSAVANQWNLLLDVNFSSPSVEIDSPLNFGAILACVNFCLQAKIKNDSSQREIFSYILENSLMFVLSQAILCQLNPNFTPRDQQLIRRELGAELNSLSLVIIRAIRRDSLPESPSSEPRSCAKYPVLSNQHFLKFISSVVEKLFK